MKDIVPAIKIDSVDNETIILLKKPDFDPRNYGFPKLYAILKSLGKYFEINERKVENTHIKHIYIRNKKLKGSPCC